MIEVSLMIILSTCLDETGCRLVSFQSSFAVLCVCGSNRDLLHKAARREGQLQEMLRQVGVDRDHRRHILL